MDCETARTFLDPYSTGELDLMSMMDVEKHLAECSSCAKELEGLQSLRRRIQEPSLRYSAPQALQHAMFEHLAPPRLFTSRWLARAAATILLFLLPWFLWYASTNRSSATQLADEITAAHVRSLQGDHLLDVVSTDQHTVKPWFNGKLDFSPTVVDFASEGFPLVGGRLDYINHQAVAAIVYQRGKHMINVLVWRTKEGDDEPRTSQHNGYNLITWTRGGLKYSAVSDLNPQELSQLADLVRGGGATTHRTTNRS
jgi:anti-sigma factor RsiW